MKTTLDYSEFYEAFLAFLERNCVPFYDCSGVGKNEPPFAYSEIRIVLNENGSGLIHLLGKDSDTIEFRTMDHFRSQGMITPEQRKKIDQMTDAKSTKIVREEKRKLKQENKSFKVNT